MAPSVAPPSSEPAYKADETRRTRTKVDDDGHFARLLRDCQDAVGARLSDGELIKEMNRRGYNAGAPRVKRLRP